MGQLPIQGIIPDMRNLCLVVVVAMAMTSLPCTAQSSAQPSAGPVQVQPGIVVERISKGLSGERAELREGDLLLRWNRGDSAGMFGAPVELSNIEIEQRPLGKVAIA